MALPESLGLPHHFPTTMDSASDTARQLQRELRAYLNLLRHGGTVALVPGDFAGADTTTPMPWPDESPRASGAMAGGSGVAPDSGAPLTRHGAIVPATAAPPIPPPAAPPISLPDASVEDDEPEADEPQLSQPVEPEPEAAPQPAAAPEMAVPHTSSPLPPSALDVPELLAAEAEAAAQADAPADASAPQEEDSAQLDLFGALVEAPPPPKPTKASGKAKPRRV